MQHMSAGFAVFLAISLWLLATSTCASRAQQASYTFAILANAITALVGRRSHVAGMLVNYYLGTVPVQAYLTMVLSDNTFALSCQERRFQWLRYAAWGTVAPLTVAYLGTFARVGLLDIAWPAALSVVAVVTLFAAAVSPVCVAAWPLLAFAVITGVVLLFNVWGTFHGHATKVLPAGLQGTYYFALQLFTGALVAYAIVWGTAEGGKIATATQEVIVYTVLDIITKSALFLLPLWNMNSYIATGNALTWLGGSDKYDL
jgi:bacteriorhodopsin